MNSLLLHLVEMDIDRLELHQTVDVFQTVKSSVDPYICTFVVGVVQLLATGSKSSQSS